MLREILVRDTHWWLFYLFSIVFLLLVVEAGYRLGAWRRSRVHPEQKSQTGTVLAALLALLGFLLAISFGIAADRFRERKALVLEEANAIGTAFLRADLLPEPARSRVRRQLRDYVDLRIHSVRSGDLSALRIGLAESEAYHRELWALAVEAADGHPRSIPVGLFVDALNRLIDLHESRVTVGLHYHIPPSLVWTLYLVAFLSMGTLGIHFGLSGTRSIVATIALVTAVAAVLLLIVDLDQPIQRLFSVGQDPLVDVLRTLDRSLGGPALPGGPDSP
jgi:hypothetical protein